MGFRQTLALSNELRSHEPEAIVDDYSKHTRHVFGDAKAEATPVIIAAFNEAKDIPSLLVSLAFSEAEVRPIVIDNGSKDETAERAEEMGALVLTEPFPSKMKAHKRGIEYIHEELGSHMPVLFTDADTVVGARWSQSMTAAAKELDLEVGGYVSGNMFYTHGRSKLTSMVRNIKLLAKQARSLHSDYSPDPCGASSAIRFDSAGRIADEILSLDDGIFPLQDFTVRDTVIATGGIVKANICLDSYVITRGDRYDNLREYVSVQLGRTSRPEHYQRA